MKKFIKAISLLSILSLIFIAGIANSQSDFDIALSADSVKQYEELEITFKLDKEYANPFNPKEVNVEAHFMGPGGEEIVIDGFYDKPIKLLQDFGKGRPERIIPSDFPTWKIRFTPIKAGEYKVYAVLKDKEGTKKSDTKTFKVIPSENKGFIRVAEENKGYFEFDNGEPFFGIGLNIAWWDTPAKTYRFDEYFEKMKENGANIARVWFLLTADGDWVLSLPKKNSIDSNYDLEDANRFDAILKSAEENGIYLIVTFCDVNSFAHGHNWNGLNPFNKTSGGPCEDKWDFFTNEQAKEAFKQMLRYLVARYGYSPNILAFELWNEWHELQWSTKKYNVSQGISWHKEMADYIKEIDPNKHLVMTSLGSFDAIDSLWNLKEMAVTSIHAYYVKDWPYNAPYVKEGGKDMGYFIPYFSKKVTKYGKLAIFGEYGIQGASWTKSEYKDTEGIHIHNALWSGLMSGLASTPLSFSWGEHMEYKDWWGHYKGIANFVKDVDILKLKDLYKEENDNIRILGLKDEDEAIFWVQNKDYTWFKIIAEGKKPKIVSNEILTVKGLKPDIYEVDWQNTVTGEMFSKEKIVVKKNDVLKTVIPDFEKDIAGKISRIQ